MIKGDTDNTGKPFADLVNRICCANFEFGKRPEKSAGDYCFPLLSLCQFFTGRQRDVIEKQESREAFYVEKFS